MPASCWPPRSTAAQHRRRRLPEPTLAACPAPPSTGRTDRPGPGIQRSVLASIVLPWFMFFFNDTATTEIYTLSLHDALPIWIPQVPETHRCGEFGPDQSGWGREVSGITRTGKRAGIRAGADPQIDAPARDAAGHPDAALRLRRLRRPGGGVRRRCGGGAGAPS